MRTNGAQSSRETPRLSDDDVPPTGDEAHEQRKETSMPLVWLAVGLMTMAAFAAVAWIVIGAPHPAPSGAGPPPSGAVPPARLSR